MRILCSCVHTKSLQSDVQHISFGISHVSGTQRPRVASGYRLDSAALADNERVCLLGVRFSGELLYAECFGHCPEPSQCWWVSALLVSHISGACGLPRGQTNQQRDTYRIAKFYLNSSFRALLPGLSWHPSQPLLGPHPGPVSLSLLPYGARSVRSNPSLLPREVAKVPGKNPGVSVYTKPKAASCP